jgi:ankyrin repeat protein
MRINAEARASLQLSLMALSWAACDTGGVDARDVFPDSSSAALAEAVADGDSALVRELIQAGADRDARGDKGVHMIQWALLNKSEAGLAALLAAGADPARADHAGATVMHYAAMANDPAYLDILLAHGADPNTRNAVTGATPLMSALMGTRDVQFRKLLSAGADPNLSDRMGHTSLHVAAQINAGEAVLDLLEAGADPAARDQKGLTFQRYLNMTPDEVISEDFRRQREAVAGWLRERGMQVERAAGH